MLIMGQIPQMTNQQRLMVVIDSTPMCFHNSTSPWGEFSPSKTRPKSMSSTGYPMVDLTIKLKPLQVYSTDHLSNPSVEFGICSSVQENSAFSCYWDLFSITATVAHLQ